MSVLREISKESSAKLIVLLPLMAIAATGCKTTGSSGSSLLNDNSKSYAAPKVHNASAGETAKWAKLWEKNPKDVPTALEYVARLRALGSSSRTMAVLEDSLKHNPRHIVLQGEYGKELANAGKFQQASVVLQRTAAVPDSSWQIHSAKGVVLDRLGRHSDAQAAYKVALQKSPGQMTALNNFGLSQAQSGDLTIAEKHCGQHM